MYKARDGGADYHFVSYTLQPCPVSIVTTVVIILAICLDKIRVVTR